MASPTQWAWVWINSRSWWWTGRPGMLQFLGLQRVGHDWATEQSPSAVILDPKKIKSATVSIFLAPSFPPILCPQSLTSDDFYRLCLLGVILFLGFWWYWSVGGTSSRLEDEKGMWWRYLLSVPATAQQLGSHQADPLPWLQLSLGSINSPRPLPFEAWGFNASPLCPLVLLCASQFP